MRLIAIAALVVASITASASSASGEDFKPRPNDHVTVDFDQGKPGTAQVNAVGGYDESSLGKKGYSAPTKRRFTGTINADPPACIDYVTAEHPYFPVDDCWVIQLPPGQAPPPPTPPTVGLTTPEQARQYALEYARSIELPSPAPEISAPNGGICGVTHSLDLHIADAHPAYVDPDTVFGPLLVRFHGRFTVDWGDRSTGTYSTTGAPYPHSQISHSWTDRGYYDIGVIADWTAEWSFGQHSGTVSGFRTTGGITQWRVWEAQAMLIK